eukprot:3075433-Prymnesium_polylepis.4
MPVGGQCRGRDRGRNELHHRHVCMSVGAIDRAGRHGEIVHDWKSGRASIARTDGGRRCVATRDRVVHVFRFGL